MDQQQQLMPPPHKAEFQSLADNGASNNEDGCYQNTMHQIGSCFGFLRTWFPCCCFCVNYPYQEIEQSYDGLLERFGKFSKIVNPGLQYMNPCTESLIKVNTKIQILHLQNQMALTKDNLCLILDTSVYFRIIDSRKATYQVKDIKEAVANLTFATLRNSCGQHVLQDLLEKREEVALDIQEYVDEHVHDWGVKVENIFIKDMKLTSDVEFVLSSAAKERKLADSKIISARADVESAKMMKQAAEILDSDAAMQIRYLETLNHIIKSPNVRVVFMPEK